MTAQVLDGEKQQRAKEYARLKRRIIALDMALGAGYVLAWLIFGWSSDLRDWLSGYTTNPWVLIAGFAAVFGLIYYLLDLPLSFYSSFILPHRYGLSNETLKGWVVDQVKGLVIGGLLGLIILQAIYAVLRAYPDTWWLWAGAIMLFFTVILANLGPVLLAPIFFKFEPLGDEHAGLAERLTRLAERAGTQINGVYKFDMSRRTKAANAALTGLGGTRRIILGDTLIKEFSEDEIETVLAHELAHHVHRDLPTGILVETASTVVGLYLASLALNWGVRTLGFNGPADPAAFPLFVLVIGLYGLVTMPLSNAYTRWRERRADLYALSSTGKGEAYASALARLANQNLADADPEPWVVWLLYSHPPLGERIALARRSSSEPLEGREY
jgi:STE24 endopeptidase